MTTLNNILDFTGGERFYRFGNADGKYWIVPVRSMRTALNLYQPSGRKGKMVKALLPYLHLLAPVRKVIKTQSVNCRLSSELHSLLCKVFGVQDIEFAIFEGTPSASKKITIQISLRDKILGYCKISDEERIYDLFKKEYDNLQWLSQKGIKGIPRAILCEKFKDVFLFIQSTTKSNESKILHKITTKHLEYIKILNKLTSIKIPFESSDFYNDITFLETNLNKIRCCDKPIFEKGINHIKKYYKNQEHNIFSFSHGDFTPWNTYLEKGCLQVFDFEFAEKTFPPRMDLVHFALQVWILEKKLGAEEIYPKLELLKVQYGFNSTIVICYLIHILAFYIKLYKGNFDTQDNGYIVWTSLLKMQLDTVK